jgi:DNA polymerase-3 subunit epsilon
MANWLRNRRGTGGGSEKESTLRTAREILDGKPVFLDTETTGLGGDAEIVEVCVIDTDGTVLLDTLVQPCKPIPPEATAVHGITNEMVATAPVFAEVWAQLEPLLRGRPVVIYNAGYDRALLAQTLKCSGIDSDLSAWLDTRCCMEMYAEFWGDWSDWHQSYRWQRLSAAAQQQHISLPEDIHRARADAEMCRQLLHVMAANQDEACGETGDCQPNNNVI